MVKANHQGLLISCYGGGSSSSDTSISNSSNNSNCTSIVNVNRSSSSDNWCFPHTYMSSSGLGILHALSHLFLTKREVRTIINLYITDEIYYWSKWRQKTAKGGDFREFLIIISNINHLWSWEMRDTSQVSGVGIWVGND